MKTDGWHWSGPNNFSDSVREITFNNVQPGLTGTYTVTYTDSNGCPAAKDYYLYLKVDVCTGINSLPDNSAASVYPIPVTSHFTIALPAELILKNTVLKIVDVCGKEARSIPVYHHKTIVDRTGLQNGFYSYAIFNDNEKIAAGTIFIQTGSGQ